MPLSNDEVTKALADMQAILTKAGFECRSADKLDCIIVELLKMVQAVAEPGIEDGEGMVDLVIPPSFITDFLQVCIEVKLLRAVMAQHKKASALN